MAKNSEIDSIIVLIFDFPLTSITTTEPTCGSADAGRLDRSCFLWGKHPFKQVVGDLLNAIIWALLFDPMPDWIDVTRGAGQTIGPPDGGGVEHDIVLGTIVDRGGIAAHFLLSHKRITLGDDIHSR